MAAMAAPPAAVVAREMASASITAAPSSASICSTVLLPLPMPPVRPTRMLMARASYSPTAARMEAGPKIMAVRPAPARKGPNGT